MKLVTYEPDTRRPSVFHAGRHKLRGGLYAACRGTSFPGARELYDEEVESARPCMRCVAMRAIPRRLRRTPGLRRDTA